MAPTVLAMRTQSLVGAPVQRRQLTQLSAGQPLVRLPQLQQHRVRVLQSNIPTCQPHTPRGYECLTWVSQP